MSDKVTNKKLIDKHRELWQRRHDGIVAKAPEDEYRWIESVCMDASMIMASRLESKIKECEELTKLVTDLACLGIPEMNDCFGCGGIGKARKWLKEKESEVT